MAVIRTPTQADRELYLALTEEFYASGAALLPAAEALRRATFAELMRSTDYAECFFIEWEGTAAGYALASKTFSPVATE